MSARADLRSAAQRPGWGAWLRRELAYTPGRDLTTARIVVTVALVTVISMALRVPEAAVSAYMVVFVTKENRVVTTLAGALAILGITVAIAASLLIDRYTFDYPVLRIPSMAAALFAGMFLSRVFAIGPLGFAIGFVVAVTQGASDDVPNAELLVRGLLWLWVALVYPIALTVVVNQFLFPAEPWVAFTSALNHRLDFATGVLRRAADDGEVGGSHDTAALELATRGSMPLLKLLHFAEGRDPRLKARHASLTTAVAASEQLARAAAALVLGVPRALTESDQLCARQLASGIEALRGALPSLAPVSVAVHLDRSTVTLPELRNFQIAASTFADSLGQTSSFDTGSAPAKTTPRKSLLVPDAFTNPAHVHFALKVTLAAMSCYVLYVGLDWPGIHTALITCCIIALESAGATRRKGWLRLAGCCIGGMLGFLSLMYLVPIMESIVSLVLLVSVVTALAGWVAAGSERIAYGGLQIALAFYLGIFQDYAPGTDFDKIRDRLVGIILGIIVSSIVFRYIWPERARDRLRAVIGRVLRALADLVRFPVPGASPGGTTAEVSHLHGGIASDLDDAVRLTELASLEEPTFDPTEYLSSRQLGGMVRHAQAVFLIGNLLTSAPELDEWAHLPVATQNAEAALRDGAAIQLSRVADLVNATPSPLPNVEKNDMAAIDPPERARAANHRLYLLRRLTEQIQRLGLSRTRGL